MKNLANELRPKKLQQIVGQEHIKKILSEVVKKRMTNSFIFFGEPGIGKTSTAICLANELNLSYSILNPAVDNKKDLMKKLDENQIIIIDEIHRLNKDKQDILLSYLEYDKIIIYATTTENPYFRVNPALRSRMQILQFNKLTEDEILKGIKENINKNLFKLKIDDDVLLELIRFSSGDYRSCLNNLQMLSLLKTEEKITKLDLKKIIPNINFYSDMNSSSHYNNLSAFHKSLRGSDVHAALYYGELILKTGDYLGLFRRLNAAAYEDVGLADINLPIRIEAAFQAVERLGFPEANLPIYYIIISVALAPKSNSVYKSMKQTQNLINSGQIYDIPNHLKDAHYKSASKLDYGIDYKYPHDYNNHYVKQEYLPKKLKDIKLFCPNKTDNNKISEYYEMIKKWKEK
ncbi:replication-associated recombination protein A [Mycoplasmopsis lipofaciens]|uniref:replication-associated recombination protein A n=1 Tax=Mycoplasmopsis lipofaciens TaxID=114884 RepID=UPI000481FD91|nr:replication-associated recombination protein A [Mycoplasmopsis lipofaciens]